MPIAHRVKNKFYSLKEDFSLRPINQKCIPCDYIISIYNMTPYIWIINKNIITIFKGRVIPIMKQSPKDILSKTKPYHSWFIYDALSWCLLYLSLAVVVLHFVVDSDYNFNYYKHCTLGCVSLWYMFLYVFTCTCIVGRLTTRGKKTSFHIFSRGNVS